RDTFPPHSYHFQKERGVTSTEVVLAVNRVSVRNESYRMRIRKHCLLIAIFVSAIVGCSKLKTTTAQAPAPIAPATSPAILTVGLQVGNLAPEIEGEDIDGKNFKLSDYRGKVVLLDFWGHW